MATAASADDSNEEGLAALDALEAAIDRACSLMGCELVEMLVSERVALNEPDPEPTERPRLYLVN